MYQLEVLRRTKTTPDRFSSPTPPPRATRPTLRPARSPTPTPRTPPTFPPHLDSTRRSASSPSSPNHPPPKPNTPRCSPRTLAYLPDPRPWLRHHPLRRPADVSPVLPSESWTLLGSSTITTSTSSTGALRTSSRSAWESPSTYGTQRVGQSTCSAQSEGHPRRRTSTSVPSASRRTDRTSLSECQAVQYKCTTCRRGSA